MFSIVDKDLKTVYLQQICLSRCNLHMYYGNNKALSSIQNNVYFII